MSEIIHANGNHHAPGVADSAGNKIRSEDQRLLPLEIGARLLCKMRGEDPDRKMQVPHPNVAGVFQPRTMWLFAADEMVSVMQVLQCIQACTPPAALKSTIIRPS